MPFPDNIKPKSTISGWKMREGSIMRIKVEKYDEIQYS